MFCFVFYKIERTVAYSWQKSYYCMRHWILRTYHLYPQLTKSDDCCTYLGSHKILYDQNTIENTLKKFIYIIYWLYPYIHFFSVIINFMFKTTIILQYHKLPQLLYMELAGTEGFMFSIALIIHICRKPNIKWSIFNTFCFITAHLCFPVFQNEIDFPQNTYQIWLFLFLMLFKMCVPVYVFVLSCFGIFLWWILWYAMYACMQHLLKIKHHMDYITWWHHYTTFKGNPLFVLWPTKWIFYICLMSARQLCNQWMFIYCITLNRGLV